MNIFKIVVDVKHQLRKDEGVGPVVNGRLMPYKDSLGYLTIGYGRCLDKVGISRDEAERLLENDVSSFVSLCIQNIPFYGKLDAVRQSVLANMAFNLGINGLLNNID